MITIERRERLDAAAIAEVQELQRECDAAEGLSTEVDFDTSLNFHRGMDAWFLAREGEGGRLLGFLSIFAPEAETAEVTAAVRPGARRRGLFSRLLAEAEAMLGALGYRELLFLAEAGSASGAALVGRLREKRGAVLDHREFSMRLPPRLAVGAARGGRPGFPGILISRAGTGDLVDLVPLCASVYGESEEESRRFLESTLAVPERRVLVARLEGSGSAIGLVSIFAGEPASSINGLLVAPEARRRGLGSALLDEAVRVAAAGSPAPIGLEVDAENRGALGIYLRRGFEVVSETEYWRAPLVDRAR